MINFTAILFALVTTAAPHADGSLTEPFRSLPSPREVKLAITRCGLVARKVSVKFDRTLQEDVVWIGRGGDSLTAGLLECVAQASYKSSYYVYFKDAETQKRYDPIYWRLVDIATLAQAKNWMRERNLLATMPIPQKGEPLSTYAEAVEDFCGVKKRALLVARDEFTITFAEGGLGRIAENGVEDAAATEAQFMCVMNATAAADLKARGLFFGFIGNAAREDVSAVKPKRH